MTEKILIMNTFGIGDVLFTTPLIRNLKRQRPGVNIGYLANARTAEFLRGYQLIDDVFVYERDEFVRLYRESPAAFWRKARGLLQEIRCRGYGTVIDLSLNRMMGFLTWAAGIPRRVGYDYKGRGRLLTHRLPLRGFEGRHVAEYYLDLLPLLGVTPEVLPVEFPLSDADRAWAADLWRSHGLEGAGAVVLAPGGGGSWGQAASLKRWPVDRFAELANKVIEKFNAPIILVGSSEEKAIGEAITRETRGRVIDCIGKTRLGEMAALFARGRLVVANDGGPLHMAVGVGARTVSIFGPVDPLVYGPFPRGRHEVVVRPVACRPCYRRFRSARCAHRACLRDLPVADVVERVAKILSEGNNERRNDGCPIC